MGEFHTVRQGETLAKIALHFRFLLPETIYQHPSNDDFRRLRPNPDILHPGDVIFIPDKELKQESCATEAVHRFKIKRRGKILRIAVEDPSGTRFADTWYELLIDGKPIRGKTDHEGILEQTIRVEAEAATLKIAGVTWSLKIGHLNPIEDTPDQGVSGIQARLQNLGYRPGPVDGIMGPRTEAAIRAFQTRHHPPLPVDGVCGSATLAKLKEAHGS